MTADLLVNDSRRSDETSPKPKLPRRWVSVVREIAFLAMAALAYSLVRGLTDDRVELAFSNAEQVIAFERTLGIFIEPDLQAAALGSNLAVNAANAVYIGYWPILIGALGWLLLRHPIRYRYYRNAMLASGALSLAIFAAYPLAPPRFLPEHGFVDTIAAHSDSYRDFNASALVNEYAAMPSLHVGWILLANIAILATTRHRIVRVVAVAMPALMFTATVLTANHYIVDGAAGAVVVLVGLAIASTARRRAEADGTSVSAADRPRTGRRHHHRRRRRRPGGATRPDCEDLRPRPAADLGATYRPRGRSTMSRLSSLRVSGGQEPGALPVMRGRVVRVLMGLPSASALAAAATAIGAVADAEPSALMVETWRMYGFVVFAALFALLAWRPLHYRWLWEIVIVNKLLLAVTAGGYATGVIGPGDVEDATAVFVADSVIVAVVVSAYLVCRGWRATPHRAQTGEPQRDVL